MRTRRDPNGQTVGGEAGDGSIEHILPVHHAPRIRASSPCNKERPERPSLHIACKNDGTHAQRGARHNSPLPCTRRVLVWMTTATDLNDGRDGGSCVGAQTLGASRCQGGPWTTHQHPKRHKPESKLMMARGGITENG